MCLASGAMAQNYQQKEYVFTIPEGSAIQDANAQQECTKGLNTIARLYDVHGINANSFGKYKISSLATRKGSGRVTDNNVSEVGEILFCMDWQTYWLQGRNLIPTYMEVKIGGKRYRIQGAGTSPNFPNLETLPGGGQALTGTDFPQRDVGAIHFSGTVLPSVDGKPGGMFNWGGWNPYDGLNRFNIDHYGIGVLQVMLPVNQD